MNRLSYLLYIIYHGASSAVSDTYAHKGSLQKEKYHSLPHTVFSPHGRLYNIERNAASTSDPDDLSSSLVIALKFGDCGSVLLLSAKPSSPHVYDQKIEKKGGQHNGAALWTYDNSPMAVPSHFMVLPLNIMIGNGGNAADCLALRQHIHDIALSLYKANEGMRSTHLIKGTVTSSMIAKRVADHLQLPTQSAAKNRSLSSAAIVVGPNCGDFSIWRCDPTGQFWDCHAAAVGRGAGDAEATLMYATRMKKSSHNSISDEQIHIDDLITGISSRDVKQYLSSISFDDTIVLVCKCLVKALGLSNEENLIKELRLEAILVHKVGKSSEFVSEYVRNEILIKALQTALCDN